MTTTAEPRTTASRQTGMQLLAGALAVVCLVLFLLAIEQKHAVEAWRTVRDGTGPAIERSMRLAGALPTAAAEGLAELKTSVPDMEGRLAAAPEDQVLAGSFSPADEATRAQVGAVEFAAGTVRFASGDILLTRPLRIAAGREQFAPGQTFADHMDARPDAQIELRRVEPATNDGSSSGAALCGDQAPGVIALLHRQNRVDLMLFHSVATVGPEAPLSALCGAWSFRR